MAQVINIAKYKTNNKINSIAKHNLRCYIPDNVDASKQKDNIYFVGQQGQRGISRLVTNALKDIEHRKDANKVVNLVFSASSEEFEKWVRPGQNNGYRNAQLLCSKVWQREYFIFCLP